MSISRVESLSMTANSLRILSAPLMLSRSLSDLKRAMSISSRLTGRSSNRARSTSFSSACCSPMRLGARSEGPFGGLDEPRHQPLDSPAEIVRRSPAVASVPATIEKKATSVCPAPGGGAGVMTMATA